jgi:hypothetical protein
MERSPADLAFRESQEPLMASKDLLAGNSSSFEDDHIRHGQENAKDIVRMANFRLAFVESTRMRLPI